MKGLRYMPLLLAGLPLFSDAQSLRDGYIDWGVTGIDFPTALETWEKGRKWTDDDNFFISRVKPKARFRNRATQVDPSLDESKDKNLMYWIPINRKGNNALPDGVYDSEVFPMWQYITHFGNWSTSLIRIPGGFADVAHKNGVPVSAVASVPYGKISKEWRDALYKLTDIGARKISDYLLYYGVDGIGYNSEFQSTDILVKKLGGLHEDIYAIMHGEGLNPCSEIIWYDGTSISGGISFDQGLDTHNSANFGSGDNIRSSLFFNYNWNEKELLDKTVDNAKELGRSPLDIYCGINMQGREPKIGTPIWTLLAEYPLSIGLWGAHNESMFFETRAEYGSTPDECQRTYEERVENWFTGSTHNPVTSPEIGNSLNYSSENKDFQGMSRMMSARSSLKWDLSDEPFITYFNLGNGRFFNYKGERSHNSEWYNISIQDYLPTWRWWFSSRFMGRNPEDVNVDGLKAEFVWDDAWMGGSTVRIHGSSPNEYLHLLKTEFALKDGDEITFRYKPTDGVADAFLVLSLKDSEATPLDIESTRIMNRRGRIYNRWIEKKFVVGRDVVLPAGAEVAMVALKFSDADNLDMLLGEFSIVRKDDMKAEIATPVIEKTELLSARHDGYDGKIIFNMPNDKVDETCYNSDVNTSMFKLYAQQEGEKPVLMGMTTSWAGLMFSVPFDSQGNRKVRFGVSALALDHISESPVAWGEYIDTDTKYEISDALAVSSNSIHAGESFSIGYIDPFHEKSDWKILDSENNIVYKVNGSEVCDVKGGLDTPGLYSLVIYGYGSSPEGRVKSERELKGYIQIVDGGKAIAPQIVDILPVNAISTLSSEDGTPIYVFDDSDAVLSFSANMGDSPVSRAVKVGKEAFGFKFKDSGLSPSKSFSISFWMKPESFDNKSVHALSIRHKGDPWAINNWGWFHHTLNEDGTSAAFQIRMEDGPVNYNFKNFRLYPGVWQHLTYVFEIGDDNTVRPSLFVNGERQEISGYSKEEETFEGEPPFLGPSYTWNDENVVALGGPAFTSGSINCNLDNFMVWSKALDPSEVEIAMGDIDESRIPESLAGYFDFENEPDIIGLFPNKGNLSFGGGMLDYVSTEVEGQGELRWRTPVFVPGSPFLLSYLYRPSTNTKWQFQGGKLKSGENFSNGGKACFSFYDSETDSNFSDGFPVKLRLENEYGSDEKSCILRFNRTEVKAASQDKPTLKVQPVVFQREISIEAPDKGYLNVSMFSLDGKKVHSDYFLCNELDSLKIFPDVATGVYILSVEKDGKALGSSRVMRQ